MRNICDVTATEVELSRKGRDFREWAWSPFQRLDVAKKLAIKRMLSSQTTTSCLLEETEGSKRRVRESEGGMGGERKNRESMGMVSRVNADID